MTRNSELGAHQYQAEENQRATVRPIRILHVLGGMDRGGVETWLMHVLRNIDRDRFRMDFLVHTDRRSAYDDELESLGSRLLFCPTPSRPWEYVVNFRRIVRSHGPYDVVHSHVHHFSGFVLGLAKSLSIPTRIAHSHSDTRLVDSRASMVRKLYNRVGKIGIQRYASSCIGCSSPAADSLFGSNWKHDDKTSISHCGIDFESFHRPGQREKVRRELGLPEDALVIGHVGRFCPPKNHRFLLQIHAALNKLCGRAHLLLVGQGSLESEMRELASKLGIADRVTFAGARSDVPWIMLGAMDGFVMPSLYEGLSLAALEAQAAGLPTILSGQVPTEVDMGCGLVKFLPLTASPASWASAILECLASPRITQVESLEIARKSSFAIEQSLQRLSQLYLEISARQVSRVERVQ